MSNYTYFEGKHYPIKTWSRGVSFDNQTLNQLYNLTHLPFIHRHVAAMPDAHVGIGATVGSVIATKGAIVPAAVGVDIGCFRGDTKIPLLDGTQVTLESLAERTEPFWVYSINNELKVVPGRATCVKTRSNAELMRVVVSGGDEIFCTPDHEFMLNDGTYREARNLKFNDSLMPLYRRWQTRDGYESTSNGKGTHKMTHILVWEAGNGPVPKGYVVHHRNHIHFDNEPENLELMEARAHSSYHRRAGHSFDNSDLAFQALRRAGISRRVDDPEAREKMVAVGTENITRYMSENPEHFAEAVSKNGQRGAPYLTKFNTSPRTCNECSEELKNPSTLRWHKKREHGYNHKILLVEATEERADVYCLQVEEHHNFALSAGVFVHNCGMMAVQTSLTALDLPDSLESLYTDLVMRIPHGRTAHGGEGDKGAWAEPPPDLLKTYWTPLKDWYQEILIKHPKAKSRNLHNQLGTLGSGNHFIELCLDEQDRVWIMLHSGSRGPGNRIGSYFISQAKEEMEKYFIDQYLPDKNLSYLVEHTTLFDDYCSAVDWAQEFAKANRLAMMELIIEVMHQHFKPFISRPQAINCHHNYIARENHFNTNVFVTRKGALRAREGDMGIIPGSMGAKSYIVRGKGNPDSFNSCSHGAGRVMSRTEAKRTISLEQHQKAMTGIQSRLDEGVLDESPAAYKDIDAVMAAQADLVDIVHTLRQILNIKG